MQVARTIHELRLKLDEAKQLIQQKSGQASVGFVPTMGYLHEGHASLLERARKECSLVVLSIFVNPLQFGPNEDFERYPRDEQSDLRLAESCGADLAFLPDVKEMYPNPIRTVVSVSGITDKLCGASRPGHFDGVATVVSKLFHIVTPDRAYFGMKDAQQVAVIRQMTDDLNMRVTIVPCPTLREEDGLAKSSRNVYLNPEERKQAVILSQALARAEDWLPDYAEDLSQLRQRIIDYIHTSPLAHIDYVEIVRYPSLEPIERWSASDGDSGAILIALAVKFGNTRLIDNRLIGMM